MGFFICSITGFLAGILFCLYGVNAMLKTYSEKGGLIAEKYKITCFDKKMLKWEVDFYVTLDKEQVGYSELNSVVKGYILTLISKGVLHGEVSDKIDGKLSSGYWSVNILVTLDGKEVLFNALEDSFREHIIDRIEKGIFTGFYEYLVQRKAKN